MKFVRCTGAAALVALVLLAIPGADRAMAAAPTVSIDSPASEAQLPSAFAITGSAHQDGNQGTITHLTLKLSGDDGWTAPTTKDYSGTPGGVFSGGGGAVSYNWPGNAPTYNGPYTITVTATGEYQTLTGTQSSTTPVTRSIHVVIPPVTPTGVTATKPSDSTVVTIKWNKNPEPDMVGYDVWRSYQGAAAKRVGSVDATKTTFTDDLANQAPGQYKYGVYAVRHARSCKSPNDVDAECSRPISSAQAGQSNSVTVQGTAQSTTTTTIKKTGGGSTGGGSTGGGSTGDSGSTSGGSTSSGSTKGGAGYKSGTGGAGFPSGGEVDLSQFGKLLNPSAKASGGSGESNIPEGTYDPTLPYGEKAPGKSGDNKNLITIGGTSIPQPSDDWVKFIGLGSFVTALLVHVLWFKQQVDRLPLEAIN